MIVIFFGFLFSSIFLLVPILKAFLIDGNHDNLIFSILCNAVFILSTTLFAFYFQETLLAFFSSIFLFLHSLLLIHDLQKISRDSILFVIPYFCFTFSVFLVFTFLLFF